jgi:hypothetical protein
VSSYERNILELPVRYGGLGITNPARIAQREYNCSREITRPAVEVIVHQDQDVKKLSLEDVVKKKAELKNEKEEYLKTRYEILLTNADQRLKKPISLAQAREKWASSWLTALPLKSLNYTLNKQEFQVSVQLRYGWAIKGMPNICSCGKNNIYIYIYVCTMHWIANLVAMCP